MKPSIHSVKHIVQTALTVVQEQTKFGINIAGTVVAEPANPPDVVVGSDIKAVYFEYWLLGESAQPCTTTWIIEKRSLTQTAITQAEMQNLHDYGNKRNILKMGQGIIGDSNSNPIPVLREWVKIPRGKQRFAQDDRLELTLSVIGESANGMELCGFAVYKEYQ